MSLIRHRFATALCLIVVSTLVAGCAQQATTPPVAQDAGQDAGDGAPTTNPPSEETAPQALAPQPAPQPTTGQAASAQAFTMPATSAVVSG